jgi:rhodanese-related sulfurtransferase
MLILDVREKEEFEAEHIPGSISCPMSQLDLVAPGILKNITQNEVIVMCRTGNRARLAIGELQKFGVPHQFSCYEGGILKWKGEGREVAGTGGIFPIMRQVQILASTMIFLAFILSSIGNPHFIYLALFVGFGLGLAGWTGFCPAAFIIQRMPWNRKQKSPADSNTCCK